ncbi:glycoside hydrolase family 108 protein [Camelimonas abortus]|uniref:glycoside hydrolase family 108 protein n=1 Tax=Camelimonas abortus TaxID=1017184 RepID=UPI0035E7C5C4
MVASSQRVALARVLAYEGGSVDDPRDPGGRTSRGVTQRVYDAWRRGRGLPARDVFRISAAEARAIYIEQYWRAVRADDLPAGVDFAVFDAAVNSGPTQAAKWLQRALGVRVDGVVGQVTIAAARAHPDKARLVSDICRRRMTFLKQLKTWGRFGRGWSRRVSDVERQAIAMIAGGRGRGEAAPAAAAAAPRAEPDQLRAVRGAGIAPTLAGAGLAAAAAAETMGQMLRQAGEEMGAAAGQLAAPGALAAWLGAAGAVLLALGVGWRLYVAWRRRLLDEACAGGDAAAPWPRRS